MCGGRQVTSRRALAYRGFPLGPFKVQLCCDCGEVVFDSAAWSAMRAVDRSVAAAGGQLTSRARATLGPGYSIPGSGQVATAPLAGAGLVDIGATATAPVTGPDTVKLVTLPALD